MLDMQLEDALVLLCIANTQPEQHGSSGCCTSPATAPSAAAAAAAAAAFSTAAAKHSVLHATLKHWMHASYMPQQQQQQQPSRVKSVKLLCVRAVGVITAERQAWCDQQLEHMWGCLKQVGRHGSAAQHTTAQQSKLLRALLCAAVNLAGLSIDWQVMATSVYAFI
jgi:hypothetical protein